MGGMQNGSSVDVPLSMFGIEIWLKFCSKKLRGKTFRSSAGIYLRGHCWLGWGLSSERSLSNLLGNACVLAFFVVRVFCYVHNFWLHDFDVNEITYPTNIGT